MSSPLELGMMSRAINENPLIDMLLNKYNNMLSSQFCINNVAMFMIGDNGWECLFAEGLCLDEINRFEAARLAAVNDITYVSDLGDEHVKQTLAAFGFGIIIPVFNRHTPIAYLLVGREGEDLGREERYNIDPLVKNLLLQSISDVIIVSIENFRLFNESLRQEAIKKELELAAHVQSMLIPRVEELPRNQQLVMNAFYKPHHEVGGDYFDCIDLGNSKIGFCVADVSGKGMAAALLMSNFQATLRALFTSDVPMEQLMGKLNDRVLSNAKGYEFITLFIARYDYDTNQMEYVNGAHTTSILYGTNSGKLHLLESYCPGLGMLNELKPFEVRTVNIAEHSLMLSYTDGLVELLADDDGNVLVTFDTILQQIRKSPSIDEAVANIVEKQELNHNNRLVFDDVTLLGVEFLVNGDSLHPLPGQ